MGTGVRHTGRDSLPATRGEADRVAMCHCLDLLMAIADVCVHVSLSPHGCNSR